MQKESSSMQAPHLPRTIGDQLIWFHMDEQPIGVMGENEFFHN